MEFIFLENTNQYLWFVSKNLNLMSTSQSKITFKNLLWFYLAANSLLLSGAIISNKSSFWILCILIWCNISGLFLIYRFNDCIDQEVKLRLNIYRFFSFPSHKIIFIQLVFCAIPIAFFFLEKDVLWILAISSILGFLYSFNFKINNYSFQLKNIFFVKNLLIGLVWGSLVLIGSNGISHPPVILLFIYCSLQVFIGGVIRDVPDLEMDRLNKVKSFPVVIGLSHTIKLLHIINLMSAAVCFFIANNFNYFMVFFIPSIWRFLNLVLLNKSPDNSRWSQWMNLFTCVLIFLSSLFYVITLR
jgi:4-hydroxybenzoate polyprenyltransferase